MAEWQQQRALEWIEAHWKNDRRKCPICAVDDWGVGDALELRPYGQEGTFASLIRPQVTPLIPLVCKNCGHTYLMNGVIAGLFPHNVPDA
jgi:hypothetical protein